MHLINFLVYFLSLTFMVQCDKQIIIAHRGASGYLPEHSLESKVLAFMMNSDYIEQDLVLTKDNVPIVLHDIYLDEVTDVSIKFGPNRTRSDSRYYAIDFTLNEIKTLNLTERFKTTVDLNEAKYKNRFPLWKSSFQISTFAEEIELIQGLESTLSATGTNTKQVGIYPEIKRPYFHRLEGRANFSEIILNILKTYNYTQQTDPIFLQCFDPSELIRIKYDLNSQLKLIQLLSADQEPNIDNDFVNYTYWNSNDGLKRISEFAYGIGPEKNQLLNIETNLYSSPSRLYLTAKSLNLKIHPYTFRYDALPQYTKTYNELLDLFLNELNVDGIFTDFPNIRLNNDFNNNSFSVLKAKYFNLISILFLYFLY